MPSANRTSKTATSNAQPGFTPAKNNAFSFDASLDDDFLGSGLDLALEFDEVRSHSSPNDNLIVKDRRWPTGTTPEPGSARIETEQVQPLTSWGPVPTLWWHTPFYAYLVFLGRRELLRQVEPVSQELHQVEARRDECLSTLASGLRAVLVTDASYHAALQPVAACESVQLQANTQLKQVEVTSANELQSLITRFDKLKRVSLN